jgi:hypothetical protein
MICCAFLIAIFDRHIPPSARDSPILLEPNAYCTDTECYARFITASMTAFLT